MNPRVALFDEQFERLHHKSRTFIQTVSSEVIYLQPSDPRVGVPAFSCGELVLRSAGIVEQTFGGITTNLWDDPFEWTLPETLSTRERMIGYLDEVEATRRRGFESFKSDDDLMKEIVVPSGARQIILSLLLDTLVRAVHYSSCAVTTFRLFSDARISEI